MSDGEWRWLLVVTVAALVAVVGVWRLDVRLDRVEDGRLKPAPVEVVVTYAPAPERPAEPRPSPSRASRTRSTPRAVVRAAGAASWATSRDAVRVANCESADLPHWPYSSGDSYLGDAHLRDPNGHDGKWQFAPSTWRSVGGHGRAYDAPEREQDYRAWLLWKREGWRPWTCARKLGVS